MTTIAILYRETTADELTALLEKHQLVMPLAVMRTEGRRLATTINRKRDQNGGGVLLLEIPLQDPEFGQDFTAVFFNSRRYEYSSQGQLQNVMQEARDAWETAGRPDEFFIEI